MPVIHILDYVAGNIKSLVNAIERVGHRVEFVQTPQDISGAEVAELVTNILSFTEAGFRH